MVNINNNFNEEVINYNGLCVCYFGAPCCGPCKMFSPIFENLSKNMDEIKFCKLNVDENKNICKKYGVMSIPTIILFKNGEEIKRNNGFLDEDSLKKFLTK